MIRLIFKTKGTVVVPGQKVKLVAIQWLVKRKVLVDGVTVTKQDAGGQPGQVVAPIKIPGEDGVEIAGWCIQLRQHGDQLSMIFVVCLKAQNLFKICLIDDLAGQVQGQIRIGLKGEILGFVNVASGRQASGSQVFRAHFFDVREKPKVRRGILRSSCVLVGDAHLHKLGAQAWHVRYVAKQVEGQFVAKTRQVIGVFVELQGLFAAPGRSRVGQLDPVRLLRCKP